MGGGTTQARDQAQACRFVDGRTGIEDFRVLRGREMLRAEVGDSPLTDVVWATRERAWELLPIVGMRAVPGSKVDDAVVDLLWSEFRAVADAEVEEGVDGVFLIPHGSMMSGSLPDVRARPAPHTRRRGPLRVVSIGILLRVRRPRYQVP